MPNRAARRAAMRKFQEQAKQANTPTVVADTTILTTAFDFTDEEDDALSLAAVNPLATEKALAVGASPSSASEQPAAAPVSISEARLAANRANAQHSTGPRSSEGKTKASLNAVKTGLTGQTVVLPTDDAVAYQAHIARHFAKYAPLTDDEHTLVQSIADTNWRLLRIAPLEAAIYSIGHREFAQEFSDEENPTTRTGLIRAKTMLHYRRDLSNLALQERRLRNHLEKDMAQLKELQIARVDKRKRELAWCDKHIQQSRQTGTPFNPTDCGFDFSAEELQTYLDRSDTQYRLVRTRPDFDQFLATYRSARKGAAAA